MRLEPLDGPRPVRWGEAAIRAGHAEHVGCFDALLRLWQEKRGQIEPEDLSGNLLVQLGGATEELSNLDGEGRGELSEGLKLAILIR